MKYQYHTSESAYYDTIGWASTVRPQKGCWSYVGRAIRSLARLQQRKALRGAGAFGRKLPPSDIIS